MQTIGGSKEKVYTKFGTEVYVRDEVEHKIQKELKYYYTATDVDKKFETLATTSDVATNKDNINDLKNKAATTDATLTDFSGRMAAAESDIDGLQADMSTAKSDIGTLKSDMSTAKSDIGTLKSDMSTAKSDIGTLKTKDTELGQKIDAETANRITSDTALDHKIDAEIANRITSDTALDQKIDKEIQDRENAIKATNDRTGGIARNLEGTQTTIEGIVKVDNQGNVKDVKDLSAETITTKGDAVIGGKLGVTGETTLNDKLTAKGEATFEKNVIAEKDLTVNGKLNVGEIYLENNKLEAATGKKHDSATAITADGISNLAKVTEHGNTTESQFTHNEKGTINYAKDGDTTDWKENRSDVTADGVKTEAKDSKGNRTNTSQTASENKTYLEDKDGKNTNSTIDTAKGYDKTIKGENGETSTKQDELNITNTAEQGTIKNDAMNIENNATGDMTNNVGGKLTTTVTGQATENFNGGLDTNVTGKENHTVTGDQNIHVTGKQTNEIGGDQENTIGGNQTTTVEGNVKEDYQKDLTTTVGGNELHEVTGTKTENVTDMVKENYGNGQETNVTGNQDIYVSENQTNTIDGNQENTIGGDQTTTVKGNVKEDYQKDLTTTVGGNELHEVTGTKTENVTDKVTENYGNGQETNVTGDQENTIGGDQTTTMTGKVTENYGNGQETNVTGDQYIHVTGKQTNKIDGDQENTIDGSQTTTVTGDISNTAENITNEANTKLTDKVGDHTRVLDSEGITDTVGGSTFKQRIDKIMMESKDVSIKAEETLTNEASEIKNQADKLISNKVGENTLEKMEDGKITTSITKGTKANTVISTVDGTSFINSEAAAPVTGASGAGTAVNTTIKGNTITTGKVTMDYAEVMKDLGVTGKTTTGSLEVKGESKLTGKVTMESDATVGGTLDVTKKATFRDDVDIKKNLSVVGDVTANSYKVGDKTYISAAGINANDQKITNVADGSISEGSKDAVNGGQLYGVKRDLEHQVDKVGANAAAMANLRPMEFDPSSKWNIAAAIGNYGSETAAALGAFYRPNDDVMVNLSTAFGTGENMVGGGVSVRLGKGGNKLSREETNALKAQVADLTARMDALLSVLNPNMSKDFPDVPENHWAYEAVSRLAGNDIVQGYPDGEFHGERTMTRYEMAEIIYNALSRGAEAEKELVEEFKPELQAMAASEKATAERAEG